MRTEFCTIDSPLITADDDIVFAPGSSLPLHFVHWRFPNSSAFTVSPQEHENALRLLPSYLNLTGTDGASAPSPQTFVGRRQVHSEFIFGVDIEYTPVLPNEEAGVTVFLTQVNISPLKACGHHAFTRPSQFKKNHHIDFGMVCLANATNCADSTVLRIRTMSTTTRQDVNVPLSSANTTSKLRLEIQASNLTHYTFSYAPADRLSEMVTTGYGVSADVSYGFTGRIARVLWKVMLLTLVEQVPFLGCMLRGTVRIRRLQHTFQSGGMMERDRLRVDI